MDEVAALTPAFAGVCYARIDEIGSIRWPCNADAPLGTPSLPVDRCKRGRGRSVPTDDVATEERSGARVPPNPATGRILGP